MLNGLIDEKKIDVEVNRQSLTTCSVYVAMSLAEGMSFVRSLGSPGL
ncbi:hypothetical protein ACFSTD_12475 [Novosphingobium colocasiae]